MKDLLDVHMKTVINHSRLNANLRSIIPVKSIDQLSRDNSKL